MNSCVIYGEFVKKNFMLGAVVFRTRIIRNYPEFLPRIVFMSN